MSEASVARQPIFDVRLKVVGYELLFRTARARTADVVDDEAATTSVVLNALTEIGLQRIVGSHRAWINASREFLLSGLVTTLPPELIGLEILEDQLIDDELVAAVTELKRRGYRLALDDFRYSSDADPLLGLVDVIKLDFLELGKDGMAEHAQRLARCGAALLAEKVESHDDHRFCVDHGFALFQGFFYRKPELLSRRQIKANRLPLLRLIAALHSPDLEFWQVEPLISRDVSLSLRLLRYINSAYFGLRHEVGSVGQALALMGLENLRAWATLTAFAGIDSKPSELTVTALMRARFCELAGSSQSADQRSQLFTLGLFSVIDALLDSTIEDVLASVPFPEPMRQALILHDGEMGRLLECVMALEAGSFDYAEAILPGSGQLYLEALSWTNDAAGQLTENPAPAAVSRPRRPGVSQC
jgi:EAL and modified HD-GYP domain-containing signal transduction protein